MWNDRGSGSVDGGVRGVRRVGSVDWGAIIGHCKEARRVVQLPGCLGVGGLRGVDPCFLDGVRVKTKGLWWWVWC